MMITQISTAESVGFNLHFYSLLVAPSLYFPCYSDRSFKIPSRRLLHQLYASVVLHCLYIKYSLVRYTIWGDLVSTYLCNLSFYHSFTLSKPLQFSKRCYFTLLGLRRWCSLCRPQEFQPLSPSCYVQSAGECYLYFNTFLSSKTGVTVLSAPKATLTGTVLTIYSSVFTTGPKVPLRWTTFS